MEEFLPRDKNCFTLASSSFVIFMSYHDTDQRELPTQAFIVHYPATFVLYGRTHSTALETP